MLHTHDEFLRAIELHPDDRTVRLVYADWLDEQNDPHAELIRIEEEMRQVPIYSDRFWELKPRRNQLRELFGSEWCARLRYGTACEPVFRHGLPDGWRERWRLIREFHERWHRFPLGDVGGRQSEIAEVEARLGLTLPPSLREWVAFSHDLHSAIGVPPAPTSRFALSATSGYPAIDLWPVAAGHHRVVLHSDLGLDDPPVSQLNGQLTDDLEYFLVQPPRGPKSDSVTRFVLNSLRCFLPILPSPDEHIFRRSSNVHLVNVDRSDDLWRNLNETFGAPTSLGDYEVYEGDNFVVWAIPLDPPAMMFVTVEAARWLTRDQIPPFLLEQEVRRGFQPRGAFNRLEEPQPVAVVRPITTTPR